jgi:hypothetical protein
VEVRLSGEIAEAKRSITKGFWEVPTLEVQEKKQNL